MQATFKAHTSSLSSAVTAEQAFLRYQEFYADGRVIQGEWHAELDGRQLACALGVLGPEINSPSKCPAAIMPRWLAQMVPWFFDRQDEKDALNWGLALYGELKRLDGKVPFRVVHDWQANYVCALAVEVASERNQQAVEPHEAVRKLHERALSGDLAKTDEWFATLRLAYAYAHAYAYAKADADAYADADAKTYAYACAEKRGAVKRLAGGMVECLRRVQVAGGGL